MATFDQLVKQIDGNLDKQRDRGTAFEKMGSGAKILSLNFCTRTLKKI